jgi:hypothetical protein
MLKNYVGKWLFPRLQRSQYNYEFKIIAVSIVFGLLVGGGVAAIMILRGTVGK